MGAVAERFVLRGAAAAQRERTALRRDRPAGSVRQGDVVALDEAEGAKNLRALDAIAPIGTGCVVELDAADPRGAAGNPLGLPGVLTDRCSQAAWYLTGNALERTSEPLRTFHITRPPPAGGDGRRIVEVEVIGRPNLADAERER